MRFERKTPIGKAGFANRNQKMSLLFIVLINCICKFFTILSFVWVKYKDTKETIPVISFEPVS